MTIMFQTAPLVRSRLGSHARTIAAAFVVAGAAHLSVPLYGQSLWHTNSTWTPPGTNVGIGTATPGAKLDVIGSILVDSDDSAGALKLGSCCQSSIYRKSADGSLNIVGAQANIVITPAVNTVFSSGNVGIGTTAPPYKLSVKGTIGAQEVIVTDTSGWSDYVFQSTYRLRPLTEVASYIKEHHHLPEIPSEAEVKEKGVSVGDMQAKLLAKIEELTLHMIQADEKNRQLQARIAQLEPKHTASDIEAAVRNNPDN